MISRDPPDRKKNRVATPPNTTKMGVPRNADTTRRIRRGKLKRLRRGTKNSVSANPAESSASIRVNPASSDSARIGRSFSIEALRTTNKGANPMRNPNRTPSPVPSKRFMPGCNRKMNRTARTANPMGIIRETRLIGKNPTL